MNKLILAMCATVAWMGSSCSNDDDDKPEPGNDKKLISPEMAEMAVSSEANFTGVLMVYPCQENSSVYYGNYNAKEDISPANAYYLVGDGSIAKSPLPALLPVGEYNFLYWGIPKNSQADSTYDNVAITEPGLRLGADLADLSYRLRKESYSDTTYFPVYDYVHAVNPIRIGTEKMQATLQRMVAGIRVVLTNRGGAPIDPSIASARILVGSIAGNLNFFNGEPSDFTKTVAFPLFVSADSLSLTANSTVMVFPSGNSPLLTIQLYLKDKRIKTFSKPLSGPLVAGNRLNLNITLGDLFLEPGASDGFEVENWNETTETINFPAG